MTLQPGLPPVAILAGGLAMRMRPATSKVPKAMIEVGGVPFIAHQLRLLRREGATHVVLCLGYQAEQVRDFVGDGHAFELEVSYSFDGESLLGTGGSLRKALPMLGPVFFVTYGDSYLDFAWRETLSVFEKSDCKGLLTVFANADRWDSSNVVFLGDRVAIYDKKNRVPEMRYIDYGAAILKAEALADYRADSTFDLGEVYSKLASSGQLMGYEVHRRFYEIGTPEGLADLEAYMQRSEAANSEFSGLIAKPGTNADFVRTYIGETITLLENVSPESIDAVAHGLAEQRAREGRLFILGVGGSAGHASHAVNDFRKICGFEAYAPTDNVSELTARTNDDGWDTVFVEWLKGSRLNPRDAVLVFSVGGGDNERNISRNLVAALDLAKKVGTKIFGIVGREGGYTGRMADACVIVPPLFADRITPHTEGLAAVIWHLLVSHPALKRSQTTWESKR